MNRSVRRVITTMRRLGETAMTSCRRNRDRPSLRLTATTIIADPRSNVVSATCETTRPRRRNTSRGPGSLATLPRIVVGIWRVARNAGTDKTAYWNREDHKVDEHRHPAPCSAQWRRIAAQKAVWKDPASARSPPGESHPPRRKRRGRSTRSSMTVRHEIGSRRALGEHPSRDASLPRAPT
jgi:hypothetical protein